MPEPNRTVKIAIFEKRFGEGKEKVDKFTNLKMQFLNVAIINAWH
jgi:hypothetical protein